MEIPITWDALKAFVDETLYSREETLDFFLTEGLVDPQEILHSLKEDIRQTIHRNEKKTHFAYEVAQYNAIYRAFGSPENVDKEIDRSLSKYFTNFPTANHTIEITRRDAASGDPLSCKVVIHFNLPWLSDQTNSRQARPT